MDNREAGMRKQWSHLRQQTSNLVNMYTFMSRADVSYCGRCGLVEGWKVVGRVTVHVFPINPYGGKVDIASHLVRFVSYYLIFYLLLGYRIIY
jgi:hypothetical protein